jgi:hypothetical protein
MYFVFFFVLENVPFVGSIHSILYMPTNLIKRLSLHYFKWFKYGSNIEKSFSNSRREIDFSKYFLSLVK